MLLTAREADETNVSSAKNFSIAINAASFEIIFRKLYSNNQLAVLRELTCNALDSHKDAGQDRKVDIILPHQAAMRLVVRDYGIGLSPEDVENLYTTVFESTKQSSDSHTGGFGLGSKAPFALTDSFSVESWWQGTHYTWFCNLDSGLPVIRRVGEELSSEPRGLRVTVAMPRQFEQHELQRALAPVKELVNVTSKGIDVSQAIAEPNKTWDTPYGQVHRMSTTGSVTHVRIKNVDYHMNQSCKGTLIFEPEIGGFVPTAARETVTGDEMVTQNGKPMKLKNVIQEMAADVSRQESKNFNAIQDWVDRTVEIMQKNKAEGRALHVGVTLIPSAESWTGYDPITGGYRTIKNNIPNIPTNRYLFDRLSMLNHELKQNANAVFVEHDGVSNFPQAALRVTAAKHNTYPITPERNRKETNSHEEVFWELGVYLDRSSNRGAAGLGIITPDGKQWLKILRGTQQIVPLEQPPKGTAAPVNDNEIRRFYLRDSKRQVQHTTFDRNFVCPADFSATYCQQDKTWIKDNLDLVELIDTHSILVLPVKEPIRNNSRMWSELTHSFSWLPEQFLRGWSGTQQALSQGSVWDLVLVNQKEYDALDISYRKQNENSFKEAIRALLCECTRHMIESHVRGEITKVGATVPSPSISQIVNNCTTIGLWKMVEPKQAAIKEAVHLICKNTWPQCFDPNQTFESRLKGNSHTNVNRSPNTGSQYVDTCAPWLGITLRIPVEFNSHGNKAVDMITNNIHPAIWNGISHQILP